MKEKLSEGELTLLFGLTLPTDTGNSPSIRFLPNHMAMPLYMHCKEVLDRKHYNFHEETSEISLVGTRGYLLFYYNGTWRFHLERYRDHMCNDRHEYIQ